ncbi:MAG: hypothetical protein JST00_12400 [Deltaproteobacteria bacterium]|nr:hypothetical protein [Deltaproteobacteria bacterium]
MRANVRALACAVAIAASGLAAAPASAQTQPSAAEKARAKEAYDRGVEAHKRGDLQRAAREFAEADALAPSNVALQAALDAAVDADDPVLGAELLDRSRRTTPTGAFAQSVEAAKKKLAGRAGRVGVTCPTGSTCRSTVDGAPMDPKKPSWVRTGNHTIVIVVDGETQTKTVDVRADQIEAVVATRPMPAAAPAAAAPPVAPTPPTSTADAPPTPSTPSSSSQLAPSEHARGGKLPPGVFWVSLGVTGAAAIVTGVLMGAASGAHSDFVGAGCERANELGCSGFKAEGESTQARANVGLAVTGIVAAATIVIGLAFTDWTGARASKTGGVVVDASGLRF